MVRNLFKHEAKAYLHTLVPMNIILLCVALFTRIIWIFESDTTIFNIIGGSSIFALCVAMLVSIVMSYAFAITRFYKNLFTQEGYLTMSLPVSPAQHISAKLVCAVGFNILTLIAVALAAGVAMAGDVFVEFTRMIVYMLDKYISVFGADGVFWIIEVLISLIISLIAQFLLYYACICIGQLTKKNRVLAAFGAYLGYYFITQILGTVFMIVMSVIMNTRFMEDIVEFVLNHIELTLHIAIIGSAVFGLLLAALYYFIVHRIMSRKLNLE